MIDFAEATKRTADPTIDVITNKGAKAARKSITQVAGAIAAGLKKKR